MSLFCASFNWTPAELEKLGPKSLRAPVRERAAR